MSEVKGLITRLENAVYQEAMAEARDASDRTLERHSSLVKEAKQALTAEFEELQRIAEAGRDFIWEPENWEAYQESKESNSTAWPPEFLLLAQAVEKKYGTMPVEQEQSQ